MSRRPGPGAEAGDPQAGDGSPSAVPAGVDLSEALGGRRGLFDSGAAGALFVLLYTAGGYWWPDAALRYALWAALAASLVLAAIRLLRRESLRQTLFGLFGVGLGALLAARSGNAANFYLPGLFIQAGYGLAYLVSVLVGWPVLGLLLGPLLGEGLSWRNDPPRKALYRRATLVWVAMFALRLAVQLPLYLAGATIALGVARLVMGWPVFLVVVWITYAMVRSAPAPAQHLAGSAAAQQHEEPHDEPGKGSGTSDADGSDRAEDQRDPDGPRSEL